MGGEREGDRRRDRGAAAVVRSAARRRRRRPGGALKPAIEAIEARRRPEPRPDRLGRRRLEPTRPRSRSWSGATTPRRAAKVGPGVPAFLSDPDNRLSSRIRLGRAGLDRPSAGPGALADAARLAAGGAAGARAGQPDLAGPFRHRAGRHAREPRATPARRPSHPELLEFLAAELARSGWSAKALHRMIVTSTAYRQSSAPRPRPRGSIPTTACSPATRCAGSTPSRSATRCSPPPASWTTAPAARTSRPTGPARARSSSTRIDPGRDAALGVSPAAPDPGRQPARGLRRPLDRHHLHPPPAVDRPAPVAQPAQFRLRRGPRGQAGRAARPRVRPLQPRTTPGSSGPSCWSSAGPRPGPSATRPAGSCESSRPDIRASPPPKPAAAPGSTSARCCWPATHSSMSSDRS